MASSSIVFDICWGAMVISKCLASKKSFSPQLGSLTAPISCDASGPSSVTASDIGRRCQGGLCACKCFAVLCKCCAHSNMSLPKRKYSDAISNFRVERGILSIPEVSSFGQLLGVESASPSSDSCEGNAGPFIVKCLG